MEQITIWIFFVIINIIWAEVNSDLTLNNKPTLHGLSASIYLGMCCLVFLTQDMSLTQELLVISSFLCLHASIFPVLYNIYRDIDPFQLSTTSTSIFDRLQVYIGLKSSKLTNLGSFILSIILLIISII